MGAWNARTRALWSGGQNEARVYAVLDVPEPRPEPSMPPERVYVVQPQRASTLRKGAAPVGSGPRNPDQRVWPPPPPPGVDLPDGLPATKAQRVLIDPELISQWREEAEMEQST